MRVDPFWREQMLNGADNKALDVHSRHVSLKMHELENLSPNVDKLVSIKLSGMQVGEGSYRKGVIDCKVYNHMSTVPLDYNGLPVSLEVRARANINGEFPLGEYITFTTVGQINGSGLNGPIRQFGLTVLDQAHPCSKSVSKHIEGDQFSLLCRHKNGKAVGFCWKRVFGNGYLYGIETFTGDNIAYIYPDLETVLIGKFKTGIMISAKETTITRIRCKNGLVELDFAPAWGTEFHYSVPSNETFGDQPTVTDPLDDKYVYMSWSGTGGQGIFAKRDIPMGTQFVQYNGLVMDHDQLEIYNNHFQRHQAYLNALYGTRGRKSIKTHQNAYNQIVTNKCIIVFPHEIGGGTRYYKATLAHKVNHSRNRTNAHSKTILDSPRYGLVKTFVAARDIKKDEEILIDYGTSYDTSGFK